jgi:hypothetical protein
MVEGGTDGQAPLDLLGLEIHNRGPVIDPPQTVGGPSVKEHRFGKGGLSGFSMGYDGDVTQVFYFVFLHTDSLFLLNIKNNLY